MGNRRVLVVDDEPDVVESISFRLGLENIECLAAGDGAEGLRIAQEQLPDLIVLDVMMPKLTGYKVARALKQDVRCRHIPIILLTARSQAGDRMLGVDSGANEYMTKPFDLDELTGKILKYLEQRERGGVV
jgi:DNA-binding response OmpR family regulator